MVQFIGVRHKLTRFIGMYPFLFFPSVAIRKQLGYSRGVVTVTPDTELVIEGFLRCANSFATRAFLNTQPRKVKVANRTHAPATVARAAQWHIPTLILIRPPKDVVLSYILKVPYVSPADAFREYITYYKRIYSYRDHYLVASFDEVTRDFGKVIDRVNRRFNTNFDVFQHNPENVRSVLAVIEGVDRKIVGNDVTRISVPNAEKELIKVRLSERLEAQELQHLHETAQNLYTDFLARTTLAL